MNNTPHHMAAMSDGTAEALPAIVLHLTPHDLARTLEALRHGHHYIAEKVADRLEAAAPAHMAILEATP